MLLGIGDLAAWDSPNAADLRLGLFLLETGWRDGYSRFGLKVNKLSLNQRPFRDHRKEGIS